MALNNKNTKANLREDNTRPLPRPGQARLARRAFNGRFRPGQRVRSDKIATVGEDFSAVVNLQDSQEMLDAYHIKKSKADSEFYKTLQADLQGAKDVQRAFFPRPTLSIPSLSCEAFYQPAQHIGGDYYDLFPLKRECWGVVIGDVSQKGIGAALMMASLQGSLRGEALYPHSDLSALVADVNQLLYASSPAHFFASLFYAEYQPATRVLRYVNAGHNPPIVLRPRRGRCEIFRLNVGGAPVGISSNAEFTTATFQLQIGDVLVGYTDGITETQNHQGELWGVLAFEKLLRSCACGGPQEIVERILDGAAGFAGGQPQRDDMTLVVLKVEQGWQERCQLPRAYEIFEPQLRILLS